MHNPLLNYLHSINLNYLDFASLGNLPHHPSLKTAYNHSNESHFDSALNCSEVSVREENLEHEIV